ncbi:MAG: uroporphyrinogen-III synthase, partial [Verrucomicrobiae bacterium]|nr:uroporphyrinogen-III synthase [Verrucomicrobiae bacterium]
MRAPLQLRADTVALPLVPMDGMETNAIAQPGSGAQAGQPKPRKRSRPLQGARVVVTRARDQAAELTEPLRARGAEVLEIPVIKIEPPTSFNRLDDALETLGEYDWLVFTSVNGVKAFFDYFFKTFEDLRDIGAVRIAAVGPATAAKIREFHLKVDVMPTEHVGEKIAAALARYQSIENVKICLLRAEDANPDLPRAL